MNQFWFRSSGATSKIQLSCRLHQPHWQQLRALRQKSAPRAEGSRDLPSPPFAAFDQHAGDEVERLLRAADDDDLIRLASDRA